MVRLLIIFVLSFLVSCEDRKAQIGVQPDLNAHEQQVAAFQEGQLRFQELVSTIRDEASYDAARPELDLIVSGWISVAASLKTFAPPSIEEQSRIRALIDDGHKRTEPTGEDMLSLISINGREEDALAWIEEFAAAGASVGMEVIRLYGDSTHRSSSDSPMQGGGAELISSPSINEVLADPSAFKLRSD